MSSTDSSGVKKSGNDVAMSIKPTNTKDNNHLVVIKGDNFVNWGIKDESAFPSRADLNESAIAIAVLNKENKLVGMALGRGNTGLDSRSFLGPANGIVHIRNILYNDNSITQLPEKLRMKVEIVRSGDKGDKIEIKQNDADNLSELVANKSAEHESNIDKARREARKNGSPQLSATDHNSDVPLKHIGGKKPLITKVQHR